MHTINIWVQKNQKQKNSFEIQRGFLDVDQITIALPEGFTIEFLPLITS
jgi:hypothetical protein